MSVRGLTKVFKDFWNRPKARAVDNVDFEVRRGEVFGLLGPNGSGKSTTVKLLLGLLYPTRGRIEVFGHSPRHLPIQLASGPRSDLRRLDRWPAHYSGAGSMSIRSKRPTIGGGDRMPAVDSSEHPRPGRACQL